VQALTDNFDNSDVILHNVYEVMRDYISVGIDPAKTVILIQSQIPELSELSMYFLNLVNLGRLERNPTVKSELQQKGLEKEIPVGFLCYPVSQTSDITAFKADLVPVGSDQVPILEQANEIIRKFNKTYNCNVLKEPEIYLSKNPRLVGIDGKAKASKSLNNAIFLADTPDIVKQKVFAMYTDPLHIKASDPGKVEGNVVFQYLDAFMHDKEMLEDLKNHYQKGGLGDMKLKNILNDILQDFLAPIRHKRSLLDNNTLKNMLMEGSLVARSVASITLEQVRDVMGINYFK
jgi:tryptophanyl-tRNA synthetase